MVQIFNKKLLKSAIEKFTYPADEKRKRIDKIIANWQIAFKERDLSKAKETSLQGKFFAKFFCEILGYTMQDDGDEVWTLKQESKTEIDGKEADGSLGFYSKTKEQTRCVIELKDAQCSLDAKQQSRENKQTPVEQAFQYLYKFANCDWVIVSNFRHTRLYHKSKGQTAYEEFDILKLHEENEFKRFYFCLCRENLINEQAQSVMDLLIKQSGVQDIDITKEFYSEFKKVRKELFNHIVENNPDYDKKLLLEKTQKLLDRFIFVYFCEDTAGLLPHHTVENIYKNAKNSFSTSPCRVWDEFKGLFVAIDKGNNNVDRPINAYNGGLFAPDEILNKLVIKDEMFLPIKELSRYDFESDLNVNILGHIFEQSLSDLEQIKNEIDGTTEDKKNSKRKKDGIFYTPEYITHFIVEETIGRYLEENPDKLDTIKILDPACGSGAFLNQAHEFLKKQHKIKIEENIKNSKDNQLDIFKHINVAENDRSILLNNIFGVDLNTESVEITKLALWLKTAHPNYKLQNLDENIKCGNSLIDDPQVAGDKAFKWENEFPEIFSNCLARGERLENGGKHSVTTRSDNYGFDVIIGNPPYVTLTLGKSQKSCSAELLNFYKNHYTSSLEYKGNLYAIFIEKAIKLAREGGYIGLIIPNTLLLNLSFTKVRKFILNNTEIKDIINLKYKVFEDAEIGGNVIIILKKSNKKFSTTKILEIENKDASLNLFNHDNYQNILQKDFFGYQNCEYYTNITNSNIMKKIHQTCQPLESYASFYNGIKTGNNKAFLSNKKENDLYYPAIRGKDISRYLIMPNNCFVLFDKEKLWSNFDESKLGKNPKIIVRQTGDSIIACLDLNGFYTMDTTHIIFDTKINIKCLLGILNSKIFTWILRRTVEEKNKTFAEVKLAVLKNLPMPEIEIYKQEKLAQKAEKMIELNEKLFREKQKVLELFELQYKPKKISKNLENFYTLGLNPFLEELEKQGVKLSLSEKEDLITWYKTKSEFLNDLLAQIETIDKEIDQEVYKLYNLTPEEIKIIEES